MTFVRILINKLITLSAEYFTTLVDAKRFVSADEADKLVAELAYEDCFASPRNDMAAETFGVSKVPLAVLTEPGVCRFAFVVKAVALWTRSATAMVFLMPVTLFTRRAVKLAHKESSHGRYQVKVLVVVPKYDFFHPSPFFQWRPGQDRVAICLRNAYDLVVRENFPL